MSSTHYGYMVSGEFHRGRHRGGGKYVTRYFISEETGIPNPSRIVENLVRLGWVEEQAISGHRRYRINVENPIKALHEFFAQVGYL